MCALNLIPFSRSIHFELWYQIRENSRFISLKLCSILTGGINILGIAHNKQLLNSGLRPGLGVGH